MTGGLEPLAMAESRSLTIVAIAQKSLADLDRFFATVPKFLALVTRDADAQAPSGLGLRAIPMVADKKVTGALLGHGDGASI